MAHVAVDPAGLRQRAEHLHKVSVLVRDKAERLEREIGPYETPAAWGQDDTGKNFHEKYGPHRGYAVDGLKQAAELLEAMAYGLNVMSGRYQNSDDVNHEIAQYLKAATGNLTGTLDQDQQNSQDAGSGQGNGESSHVHGV